MLSYRMGADYYMVFPWAEGTWPSFGRPGMISVHQETRFGLLSSAKKLRVGCVRSTNSTPRCCRMPPEILPLKSKATRGYQAREYTSLQRRFRTRAPVSRRLHIYAVSFGSLYEHDLRKQSGLHNDVLPTQKSLVRKDASPRNTISGVWGVSTWSS